ncbi:lysylphosphatidylglycerol synthase transmembrane domain-containing protein [Modicisalibacter coralii]|uniref:lysylphosphatidylglycerol synthase transmembrane domain-containing protein n=1 Tax=Modicisalibacter coralii TaxID=2304602 RepID=UPI00100B5FF3|nr:lysylphosphatidylglycerol synthase transmembrane domain-containing protein [Halomonas coralii]
MKRRLLVGAALLTALAVPLALGGGDALAALATFPLDTLAVMLALVAICWNLNALRLRLLLAGRAGRLRHAETLGIVMASEFAICISPGGSGGPLTLLGLLARRGVAPAESGAIFAVDQLTDLTFFLVALLSVALYLLSGSSGVEPVWVAGLAGSLIMALGLAGLTLRHFRSLLRITGVGLRRLGLPLRHRLGLVRRLLHFRRALIATLRLPRRILVTVFALATLHWLLRYSVLYLAVRGLGGQIDWAWTFLIQMLAMAAGQVSVLPGGAGSSELAVAALLTPMLGGRHTAAAILVWRFVTYYCYLLAGAPAFWLAWRGRARRIARSS